MLQTIELAGLKVRCEIHAIIDIAPCLRAGSDWDRMGHQAVEFDVIGASDAQGELAESEYTELLSGQDSEIAARLWQVYRQEQEEWKV